MKCPDIYNYLDFRAYLKDLFNYNKKNKKNFSYRYFAMKAGFTSTGFLKLVIDGKRNLTNESIAKIAKGFSIKKREREFFENLVFMNLAKSHEERNHYYQKMISMKGNTKINRIEKARYEYFSKWYYPVIREIVSFGDRRHTPAQIARILNPEITPKQAKIALKLLTELELIKKDESDCWEKCNKAISTGPEVKSLVVTNFHKEMIKLADESFERHPARERDISALTLSVKKDSMEEIKERVIAFRKELLEYSCTHKNLDEVIQINIQIFPLTKQNGQGV